MFFLFFSKGPSPKSLSILFFFFLLFFFVFFNVFVFFSIFFLHFETSSMFIFVLVLQCQLNDRRGRFWGQFFSFLSLGNSVFFVFKSCKSFF